jgi:hypothetical protein
MGPKARLDAVTKGNISVPTLVTSSILESTARSLVAGQLMPGPRGHWIQHVLLIRFQLCIDTTAATEHPISCRQSYQGQDSKYF